MRETALNDRLPIAATQERDLIFVKFLTGQIGDNRKMLAGASLQVRAKGRNALFVFVLSGFVPRVLALLRWKEGEAWTSPQPWLYRHVFAAIPGDARLGSLAYALAVLAALVALALWMDRRHLYVRV